MESTLRKRGLSYKLIFVLFLWISVMLVHKCLKTESLYRRDDEEKKLKYLPRTNPGSFPKDTMPGSSPLYFDLKPINGTHVTILHNAVPKTGSRTLELFLRELAIRQTAPLHCYIFPQNIAEKADEIEKFVGSLTQGSYTRGHFPFTNLSAENVNTRYINIVRPPIQRILSNYYYDLFGDKQKKSEKSSKASFHESTLDECIVNEMCYDRVYTYYKQTTLRIFCGQDPRCNEYTRWTLEKAKENARKYLFIGLTNQLSESFSILEMLLPDIFNGLTELFLSENEATSSFRTVKKIQLQNQTLEFLQSDMHLEFEFYEFVSNGFERALREWKTMKAVTL